jgi:hypothetical protein
VPPLIVKAPALLSFFGHGGPLDIDRCVGGIIIVAGDISLNDETASVVRAAGRTDIQLDVVACGDVANQLALGRAGID